MEDAHSVYGGRPRHPALGRAAPPAGRRDPQDALKPVKGAGRRWAGGAHRLWRGPAPGRLPPDPERRGIDADF